MGRPFSDASASRPLEVWIFIVNARFVLSSFALRFRFARVEAQIISPLCRRERCRCRLHHYLVWQRWTEQLRHGGIPAW